MSPAISVKQRMLWPPSHQPLQLHSHLLPSQWVCLEGNSGWRKTGHWPEIVKVHKPRNNFKKPRILQSPIYEKALKTLIWDIWFFFVISRYTKLADFFFVCVIILYQDVKSSTHISVVKTNIYTDSSLCLFETVPQSYLRGFHPRL